MGKSHGFLLGPAGPHLGTWTNLLGGWELDKVLDPRNLPLFPTFFFPYREPESMNSEICLLVGLILVDLCGKY